MAYLNRADLRQTLVPVCLRQAADRWESQVTRTRAGILPRCLALVIFLGAGKAQRSETWGQVGESCPGGVHEISIKRAPSEEYSALSVSQLGATLTEKSP